ncbi:MAG: CPBP family intramembrane metalloprotease [bacterium]|nr:CPBP family intramembrane metalloprotease [bacterium]
MERVKLQSPDFRFLLICLLVLAGSIAIGWQYFHKAFPESTIDFKLDRTAAGAVAEQFLAQTVGAPPADYKHVSRFGYSGGAKAYLEKELGVEAASKYLGHPIKLWYWQHRWFKPSTKEEFKVFVSPEGEIVWFDHDIEETKAGASLPEDSARVLAEQFLMNRMGLSLASLEPTMANKTGRPNRDDWNFEWKAKGIEPVKESSYRYLVTIQGDRVDGYREYLWVPQKWYASYEKLRSYNEMASQFASIGLILTVIAMVIVFFMNVRKKNIPWRLASIFGGITFVLLLLNVLNEFPLTLYGFKTASSWSGEITRGLLLDISGALVQALFIFLLTAWAEPIYRERYGDKFSIGKMFTFSALQTKTGFKGVFLGITLTAFFFAYQVVFYLTAQHYGAWSPSDVPYDNLLNTAMPWLAVLFIGFFPAVSEEFMSRVFSIPLLQKLFKNKFTWIAVIIPAFIWGFGHSSYPNQPFYIRGLEVGIAGVIIGYIMLKWGILPALVWHYTVDAMYTAFLMFRSDNWYFVLTAYVATGLLVIPLIVALVLYFRKGGFLPEVGLTNAEFTLPTKPEPEPVAIEVEPTPETVPETIAIPDTAPAAAITKINRPLAIVLLVIGVIAAIVPATKLGDFIAFPIPKQIAIQNAIDTLRSSGWANPDTLEYAIFVQSGNDRIEADHETKYYLSQWRSLTKTNEWFDENSFVSSWMVRFWKPENRLRFTVVIDARSGAVQSMRSFLPEELVGDSLSKDSARAIVETTLIKRGVNLTEFELKDYSLDKRPHRLDHYFYYEAKPDDPRHVGEAKYRRFAVVEGNYVTVSTRAFHKLPEKWQRARDGSTVFRTVAHSIKGVLIGALAIWLAILLILKARKGEVPWRTAFQLALLPGALFLIGQLNLFHTMKSAYFMNIATPWAVFKMSIVIAWLLSSIAVYFLFVLAIGFLLSHYPNAMTQIQGIVKRRNAVNALLAALAAVGAFLLLSAIKAWLNAWQPAWIAFTGWGIPDLLEVPLPITGMLSEWITKVFAMLAMIGFLAHLWQHILHKSWQRRFLLLFLLLIIPAQAVDGGEMLLVLMKQALLIAIVYLLFSKVFAGNYLAILVAAITLPALRLGADAFSYGNMNVSVQAAIFLLITVGGTIVWLYLGKQQVKS